MKIVIIKYNAGNVQSVLFALEKLGYTAIITDNVEEIRTADKIIFPGVGEASSAMSFLKGKNLDQAIKKLTQPVLGICLGMQLLCSHTEEGDVDYLGIFDVDVKKFRTDLKIPHIGWNLVENNGEQLFSGINIEPHCYFVHSYYADICEETTAITEYDNRFSSALQKDNFYGVQFHPEKSSEPGEQILKNFLLL
ncbi:MAG TPA: imidazole glycerol phosphate synthase subunit HisH [Chitinophagaceae bacterium]|nr:imidazole glycerol phosphate synthase subunit HisH [Chitinophagaceae bacterium]